MTDVESGRSGGGVYGECDLATRLMESTAHRWLVCFDDVDWLENPPRILGKSFEARWRCRRRFVNAVLSASTESRLCLQEDEADDGSWSVRSSPTFSLIHES